MTSWVKWHHHSFNPSESVKLGDFPKHLKPTFPRWWLNLMPTSWNHRWRSQKQSLPKDADLSIHKYIYIYIGRLCFARNKHGFKGFWLEPTLFFFYKNPGAYATHTQLQQILYSWKNKCQLGRLSQTGATMRKKHQAGKPARFFGDQNVKILAKF